MSSLGPLRSRSPEPIRLDARAADNLRYIREAMERAGEFTAVPGWGGLAMGCTALVAAGLAARQHTPNRWLLVWLTEAFVAVAITATAAARKAGRARLPLFSGPGRKFALSFVPPVFVGALLTVVLFHAGLIAALPGMWLLLYGTAIVTGGAFSVRVVPVMGLCMMVLGGVALVSPERWGDLFMAAGFGVLQILFGAIIARRYGG
ncbi:MAG TPA: hypothetical protein VF860_10200 [Candidatus Acidoferrales bacterium]|jgi:hypothetical protein|nr:hypothetical protein [Terriglobales bacterium]